jgi:hypothetical protein
MNVMTAALVLAWVCLILLAFALAGLLRQVRDLQADLMNVGAQGPRPLLGRRISEFSGAETAALVIDPGCSRCAPVVAAFAELAPTLPGLRFRVLSHREPPDWPSTAGVRLHVDPDLYQQLDVPWSPTLLVTDHRGVVTSARPIESPAELRGQLSAMQPAQPTPA